MLEVAVDFESVTTSPGRCGANLANGTNLRTLLLKITKEGNATTVAACRLVQAHHWMVEI